MKAKAIDQQMIGNARNCPHHGRMETRTQTPCLGMCSTTYGDLVCRGCRRFSHEVRDWNRYDRAEKLAVLTRLESIVVDIARQTIVVVDADRLWAVCSDLRVRGARPDYDPLCWGAELLRMGGRSIQRLEDFGMAATPAWQNESPEAIGDWINRTVYLRAEAEYDRSFGSRLRF